MEPKKNIIKNKKEVLVVFIKRNTNNKLVRIVGLNNSTQISPQLIHLLRNNKEKIVVIFLDKLIIVEYLQFNVGRIVGRVGIVVSSLSIVIIQSAWMGLVGLFAIILVEFLFLFNRDFLPLIIKGIQNSKIYSVILDCFSKNIYNANQTLIYIPTFFYFKPRNSLSLEKEKAIFLVAKSFSTCLLSVSLLNRTKKTNEIFKEMIL